MASYFHLFRIGGEPCESLGRLSVYKIDRFVTPDLCISLKLAQYANKT